MAIETKKLNLLMTEIGEEMEEIPEGFRELLEKCLIKAGFGATTTTPISVPVAGTTIVPQGTTPVPQGTTGAIQKRRNGYNIFYSTRNEQLKAQGIAEGRQAFIVKEWHDLGKQGQAPWNAQATGISVKGTRTLSDYSRFVHEISPSLKGKFKGPDLFKEAGRLWQEKKAAAAVVDATATAPAAAVVVATATAVAADVPANATITTTTTTAQ